MDIVVDHVCLGDVWEEIVVGRTCVLEPCEFLDDDLVEDGLLLGEDGLGCGEVQRFVAGLGGGF